MVRLLTTLAGMALVTTAIAAPASAQMMCGERDQMAEQLKQHFKETPQSFGLSADGAMVEVFASADGTWTMLVTRPRGPSCVISSGEAWKQLPKEESDPYA